MGDHWQAFQDSSPHGKRHDKCWSALGKLPQDCLRHFVESLAKAILVLTHISVFTRMDSKTLEEGPFGTMNSPQRRRNV